MKTKNEKAVGGSTEPYDANPFEQGDADRWQIWEMLVRRDIDAFLAADWSKTEPDFLADGFFGVDAGRDENPDNWRIAFPDIVVYRDEWLRQARESQTSAVAETARVTLFATTNLTQIDIEGDAAIAHKKFDGALPLRNGNSERLNWQTLYVCRRVDSAWKIASFVGYMKHKDK